MKTKIALILAAAVLFVAGMMWAAQHRLQPNGSKILYYSCPMHPSIKADKPGNCPECGMKLQPVYADATGTNAAPSKSSGCCSF